MAEYYPLLSKAVSGLRNGPPEKRQAIYDRARQALVGQLRSMEQANSELIDRETRALDDAIAQVEAEIGPAETPQTTPGPGPSSPSAAMAAAPASLAAAGDPAPKRPALPPRPASAPGPTSTVVRDRPTPARPAPPRPFAVPPRPTAPPRPAPAAADPKPAPAAAASQAEPTAPVLRATRAPADRAEPPILPVAPRLEVKPVEAVEPDTREGETDPVPREQAAVGSQTTVRPVAPRQPAPKQAVSLRGLIVGLVAALVVAGIGYAAWRLRDKPEALARARAALQASHQPDQQAGKVDNRADGGAAPPTIVAPDSPSGTAPPQPTADPVQASAPAPVDAPAAQAAPPPTPVQKDTPAADPVQAAPAPVAPQGQAQDTGSAPLPVSQRAAFLVNAPDEDPKVKTYVGTVVWTTENLSPGQGQPLAMAVRAEVDIPDADLKLSMLLQKNVEAQFPASHTIELRFTQTAGNSLGSVKQINVPQLRKDDTPTGDPLAGLPVTITDNYFLVGLTRGDVVARNLDLLQSRNWIDVPCLLASGKIAKVTFEKGATGDKLLSDAIQSWQ